MSLFKKVMLLSFVLFQTILLSSCGDGIGRAIPKIDLIPIKSGDVMGYINTKGDIIIAPQFKQAAVFNDGIALVQSMGKDPKWGYIDKKGSYVINPQYKYATSFSEGLAWATVDHSAPTAINESGQVQFVLSNANDVRIYKNGMAAFCVVGDNWKEQWGFVDRDGKIVIKPQFSEVLFFNDDNQCLVRNNNGKWGAIDKEGKPVINFQFDSASYSSINSRVFIVHKPESGFGVIDGSGKFIINPQYDNIIPDGKNFLVILNGKWGWVDGNGKIIINPQFSGASQFLDNALAPIKLGDKWGYINKEGKIVINPQFDKALPFNNSVALISISFTT